MNDLTKVDQLATSKGATLLAYNNGIALCDRGYGYMPFVTWRYDDINNAFYSGTYAIEESEARVDFQERSLG
jgi:hypothetical protein